MSFEDQVSISCDPETEDFRGDVEAAFLSATPTRAHARRGVESVEWHRERCVPAAGHRWFSHREPGADHHGSEAKDDGFGGKRPSRVHLTSSTNVTTTTRSR